MVTITTLFDAVEVEFLVYTNTSCNGVSAGLSEWENTTPSFSSEGGLQLPFNLTQLDKKVVPSDLV